MDFRVGQIVRSRAGRDKGEWFCIVQVEEGFLYLADGKRRRLAAPKRKRSSHAELLGECDPSVQDRLRRNETVGNRELRRALAAFREGGNHAWQKTI